MRLTRVFVEVALAAGSPAQLDGTAANHIARVLRLRAGDPVTLFDGRGGEYAARIEELRKDRVLVMVLEHRAVDRESPLDLTLVQGISRGERMDLVIQKATELGVRRIVPLVTERSVVRLDESQAAKRLRHWRAVASAACEQCGRNRLPDIPPASALGDFLARPQDGARRLLLSPHAEDALPRAGEPPPAVTLIIGPEGGLSEAEQSAAIAAGYRPARFGPRILRTETAAIAAIAAIQREFGDL